MGCIGKHWVLGFVAVLIAAVVLAADIVICPKCGYENDGDAAACTHCRAGLGGSGKVNDHTDGPNAKGSSGADAESFLVDIEHVEKDLLAARKLLSKGENAIALLFVKNAEALNRLADSDDRELLRGRLAQFHELCETKETTIEVSCRECGGSGKRMIKSTNLQGEVVEREAFRSPCRLCEGKGVIMRKASMEDLVLKRGLAIKAYSKARKLKNYVRVGNAWIPESIEGKLSIKQVAVLKTFLAAPCGLCMGFGKLDCSKCKGTGEVKCTNRKCKNGMVRSTSRGSMGNSSLTMGKKCSVCKGKTVIRCIKCKGRSTVVCKKCKGAGERVFCEACDGRGYAECAKCDGTGKRRGKVCSACRGKIFVLCKKCKGDGRK